MPASMELNCILSHLHPMTIGDSLISDIQLDNSVRISIPSSGLDMVSKVAEVVSNMPRKGVILKVGSNDQALKDGGSRHWGKT
uniref:Uncharacterized protein n=1 Tax=Romanomermis culicivorax TaxID=13658 RepID=A0A915HXK7_ROMCU